MVSVIVPNYCHSRFLSQRLDSILNQTYPNFELIILDDCSPDDGASKAVIEKYRDNPHVSHIVYNEVNSGSTFKQWDKGINLAKGELIWIAESDDYCEPVFLERMVKEFEKDGDLTLAYSSVKRVDIDGNPYCYYKLVPFCVSRLNGNDYIRRYMTLGNHCKNASACVFKKAAYDKTDKQYLSYKAGGDMLFWIEIAEKGHVAIINKNLSYFRIHPQKVTSKSSKMGINLREYKKTYDYILSTTVMSNRRRHIMRNYVKYLLNTTNLETEMIRKDLRDYWGLVDSIDIIDRAFILLLLLFRNRFGICL